MSDLPALATSYAAMLGAAETACILVACDERAASPGRWWTPADGVAAVERALASEAAIRARNREIVRIAHRQPWLIGSPDAQQCAVEWARECHTQSVERTRALKREEAA